MSHRPRLSLIAALTAVMLPATALADSTGTAGNVDAVTVFETSSDNHAMYNGSLTIKEKAGGKREYKWGGSLCPGRELAASTIALLFDALQARKQVQLTPIYKLGNGNARCLTGLKFENR